MPPSPEKRALRSRYSRSDLTLALAGLALATLCALFPWYIFYNPEQFGIRALEFEGDADAIGGAGLSPSSRLWPEPLAAPEVVPQALEAEFDRLATGTTGSLPADGVQPPGLDEQPFPAAAGDFRLIHVANGRAMIEDERGLWVVGPGSVLPDNSHVSSIERRDGRWVLVTDKEQVVPIGD